MALCKPQGGGAMRHGKSLKNKKAMQTWLYANHKEEAQCAAKR